MNDFDITKEEALIILREIIIPQIIDGIVPMETKEAYILGGQPGSGKSALAREIIKKNSNIVFVNGDDLRSFHPKYYFYLKNNDHEAADMTQAVCNFWVDLLVQECITQKLNFIIEGTMRRKEVSLNTALLLKEAGYVLNLVVVSTPYELSLLSLQSRYEELKKLGQPARFTKKTSHDEAFQNIEETLMGLIDSGLFKKFFIYKRHLGGFVKGVFESGQKERILEDFREGRIHPLEDQEKEKPISIMDDGFWI